MKKSPLTRKSPLKRAGPVKRVNKKRREAEFERAFGGEARVEWVHRQECFVRRYGRVSIWDAKAVHDMVSCGGKIEAMHPLGRRNDKTVPCCSKHHREFHDIGHTTTASKYGLSLTMAADLYDLLWNASNATTAKSSTQTTPES